MLTEERKIFTETNNHKQNLIKWKINQFTNFRSKSKVDAGKHKFKKGECVKKGKRRKMDN